MSGAIAFFGLLVVVGTWAAVTLVTSGYGTIKDAVTCLGALYIASIAAVL